MILQELSLRNFRNYEQLQLEFAPGVNILLGENAQGKTNLLEAIHVLALTRSHRTSKDRELIRWHQKQAIVAGRVKKRVETLPLEVELDQKGKRVKVNHLYQPRLSTYVGGLNVVLFAPEDLELVKGSPQIRRRFMNMEFGQMNAQYLHITNQYRTLLTQRNNYLRQLKYQEQNDRVLLGVLSEQLAQSGAQVSKLRYDLIHHLEKWAQVLQQQISVHKEQLTIKYVSQLKIDADSSVEELEKQLLDAYQQQLDREIEMGTTLIGPQRDDIQFMVNGQNVQHYGSQGQQRTTALAVKLAEIDLMKEQTGEYPLLLLDDVLSELDDDRQTSLLGAIQDKVQTFLTTTSLDGISRDLIKSPTIFHIQQGRVTKEE